jgi:hypothetical protein
MTSDKFLFSIMKTLLPTANELSPAAAGSLLGDVRGSLGDLASDEEKR